MRHGERTDSSVDEPAAGFCEKQRESIKKRATYAPQHRLRSHYTSFMKRIAGEDRVAPAAPASQPLAQFAELLLARLDFLEQRLLARLHDGVVEPSDTFGHDGREEFRPVSED